MESRWLSLLPAVERVKEQFPALLEYFNKLPEVDKKIKANDKYKRIMSILTSAEIIVQLYFLQDVKPAFDRFLEVFQTEGPLIHVLHPSMLLPLKQLMQRLLKAECIGKTVTELLCLDAKQVDLQLADEKLEIGDAAKKYIKEMKNPGKQKQCYLGIRSFFTTVISYLQKSLELNNTLVEAMQCLHPGEKEKATSIQKIMAVGKELPCIKPEELTVLTDEWRMYAEAEIPDEWLQDKDGKTV